MTHTTPVLRLLCALAISAIATSACGKRDDASANKPAANEVAPKRPAKDARAAAPAPEPDFVRVSASNSPPKPGDPVVVEIKKFSVTGANVDPADLKGATAVIELDLTSLDSGDAARDSHLQSSSYLDVARFAKVTIKVSDVEKNDSKSYSARAEVTAHGMTKMLPVEFGVVKVTPDSVQVQGAQNFRRADFGLGKPKGDPASEIIRIELRLTLKRS